MYDGFVKSQKPPVFVIPAQAEIQGNQGVLDSRSPIWSRTSFAGVTDLGTFYEFTMYHGNYKLLFDL